MAEHAPATAADVDPDRLNSLLPYAVLAPSSHNTQPWFFSVSDGRVCIFLDRSRWLRVADSDQRELHISAGCALENLLVAAEHHQLTGEVRYFPQGQDADLAAVVAFHVAQHPSAFRRAELFEAIPRRHTNHRPFDGRPLGDEPINRLGAVVAEQGCRVWLTQDKSIKRSVGEWIGRADCLQFADRAWRRELGFWLGEGVFGAGWLMSKLSRLAVTYLDMGRSTARRDTALLNSAPVLGFITAQHPDRQRQVQAGQLFERLFLTATLLGVQLHPMNQILQIPETKAALRRLLPAEWGEVQLIFRMGYAKPQGVTPRRPLPALVR